MTDISLDERRRAERKMFEEFMPLKPPRETPDPALTQLLWDMAWSAWQARAGLPPPETTTFDLAGHRVTMRDREVKSIEPRPPSDRRSPLRPPGDSR